MPLDRAICALCWQFLSWFLILGRLKTPATELPISPEQFPGMPVIVWL